MYVDESGSVRHSDHTNFFVLSGVIVEEDKANDLKRSTYDYKLKHFTDQYVDAEIHTHDILKGKGDFASLSLSKKRIMLDELYHVISNLDVITVSVVIDKGSLRHQHPSWKPFTIAWAFLIERFDKLLEERSGENNNGTIKIDKSSNRFHRDITDVIKDIRELGTDYQRKVQAEPPVFVDSSGVEGIQIADAVAYASFRHHSTPDEFERYWNLIYGKFQTDSSGNTIGCGYRVFPK